MVATTLELMAANLQEWQEQRARLEGTLMETRREGTVAEAAFHQLQQEMVGSVKVQTAAEIPAALEAMERDRKILQQQKLDFDAWKAEQVNLLKAQWVATTGPPEQTTQQPTQEAPAPQTNLQPLITTPAPRPREPMEVVTPETRAQFTANLASAFEAVEQHVIASDGEMTDGEFVAAVAEAENATKNLEGEAELKYQRLKGKAPHEGRAKPAGKGSGGPQ